MTPTPQQEAFLTALVNTTSHLALVARAGCGKTSTILLGVKAYLQRFPRAEILVCAFNKAIEQEVGEKLKAAGIDWRAAQSKTAHGLGFGLVRFFFQGVEVEGKKVALITDNWIEELKGGGAYEAANFVRAYRTPIIALVGYAKQEAFGLFAEIGDHHAWAQMASHYDVDGLDVPEEVAKVIEAAQYVYQLSLSRTDIVDYDDMVLFPLLKNLRVKFQKDLVIVDEAQDLSRARWALIRKFVKPSGRAVVVGDDRQAIYGFAGADADSLPNIIAELGATALPLSITWRCPKAVVKAAQRFVPDIEAADSAADGEVVHCAPQDIDVVVSDLGPKDAVLCRNTAPLIELAYRLIRAGKPCKVEGRAIGQGLIALVRRWKVTTIAQFLNRLEQYEEREVQKFQSKGQDNKVEEVTDRCDTLREIAKACQGQKKQHVEDMVQFIDSLFADGAENATIMATYHRAKGREWPRVILWEHDTRCPSRAARQPWQRAQEDNLAYVAITRAQQTLVYVPGVQRRPSVEL